MLLLFYYFVILVVVAVVVVVVVVYSLNVQRSGNRMQLSKLFIALLIMLCYLF